MAQAHHASEGNSRPPRRKAALLALEKIKYESQNLPKSAFLAKYVSCSSRCVSAVCDALLIVACDAEKTYYQKPLAPHPFLRSLLHPLRPLPCLRHLHLAVRRSAALSGTIPRTIPTTIPLSASAYAHNKYSVLPKYSAMPKCSGFFRIRWSRCGHVWSNFSTLTNTVALLWCC